jgi:hypothetical protein
MADDEETVAATAAMIAALVGAAAAVEDAPGRTSILTQMGQFTTSLGGMLGRTASAVGRTLITSSGLSGPSGAGTTWRDMYAYRGSDLTSYVKSMAEILRPIPVSERVTQEGDVTWANVAVQQMSNRDAARRLQEHANYLDKMDYVGTDPQLAEKADRTITVMTAEGPKAITIRNPYRQAVADSRAASKDSAQSVALTDATNLEAIETLKIASVPGFDDSRHQIKLLEALWLCGSNASLQDTPACFPVRLLTELAEAMKYGNEKASHIAAMKVLSQSYVGKWKDAVERLTKKPEVTATEAAPTPLPEVAAITPAPSPASALAAAPPASGRRNVRVAAPNRLGRSRKEVPAAPHQIGAIRVTRNIRQ